MTTNRKTALMAAKECIDAALRNAEAHDNISAEIAIDNAIRCLKTAKKVK